MTDLVYVFCFLLGIIIYKLFKMVISFDSMFNYRIVIEKVYHVNGYNFWYRTELFRREEENIVFHKWVTVSYKDYATDESAIENIIKDFKEVRFEDFKIEVIKA